MVNKGLCFVGCIVHFFLVATLLVWVAVFNKCNMSSKAWVLVMDVLFIICSITIGKVLLKLDIDKLFMKFEVEGIKGMNKVFFFAALITAILIVGFAILMVLIYFFKGIKMTPNEFLRFTVLPILSLAHLTIGTGCYLALQHFRCL